MHLKQKLYRKGIVVFQMHVLLRYESFEVSDSGEDRDFFFLPDLSVFVFPSLSEASEKSSMSFSMIFFFM